MRRRWTPPACGSGKVAFRAQGDALRALARIEKDQAQAAAPAAGQPQRAYRCDCGAWHLTKKPARVEVRHV